MGQRTIEVLSPTPPVECLSALTPSMPSSESSSPEFIMDMVRSRVSSSSMPRRTIAMHMADI